MISIRDFVLILTNRPKNERTVSPETQQLEAV